MSYAELIAEANRWPGGDGPTPSASPKDLIARLTAALEAADKKSRDLFQENYELGRQRDQLTAAVEKVREYADQTDPANLDEQPMWPSTLRDILATAPADALREHNAALIEGLAKEAGYSLVHHEEAVAFLRREARQRREEKP